MMDADTGLQADQAGQHVRQPNLDLAARPFVAHDDRAASIEADAVKRVLADVDAMVATVWSVLRGTAGAPSAVPIGGYSGGGRRARPDHVIIGHAFTLLFLPRGAIAT